ncbi:NACHT domain-containing protein [Actinoplanes sp. NPDC051346]|uniref:phosphorylase family protein n=1 Tax=Actinoplanes sp. NPDC051346 TaxID=3155048 RepID=UPI0034135E08
MTELGPAARVVIVTALEEEANAVVGHLDGVRWQRHPTGQRHRVGSFSGTVLEWQVIVAEVGRGNEQAAIATERAVEQFQAQVALIVGVAGGLKDVRVGDVVVATDVFGYEYGRDEDLEFRPRSKVASASFPLVELARQVRADRAWLRRLPRELTAVAADVRVLIEPVASGGKVIAGSGTPSAALIRRHYSQAVAVNQEDLGVVLVGLTRPDLRVAMVRGISDLLDGKAAADVAGGQRIAAERAAAFAFELLHQAVPEDVAAGDVAGSWTAAGRRRFEANLTFPLVRALLAVRSPDPAAIAATLNWDQLLAAYADRGSRRRVHHFLVEVGETVIAYVVENQRQLVQLMTPALLASVVDGLAGTLHRAASTAGGSGRRPRVRADALAAHFAEAGAAWSDLDEGPLFPLRTLAAELGAYGSEALLALPELTMDTLPRLSDEVPRPGVVLGAALGRFPGHGRPGRNPVDAYTTDYLRNVAQALDEISMFGIDLAPEVRRYSLTTGYVSLRVRDGSRGDGDLRAMAAAVRTPVEVALASAHRILLTGEAGYGKTTLLQWIAVSLARNSMPPPLRKWHGRVPFLVRLRAYREVALPTVDELAADIAVSVRQPPAWCRDRLESGAVAVLVDGLDEMPAEKRPEVRRWLADLIAASGTSSVFVVASRPIALRDEAYDLGGLEFHRVEVAPMGDAEMSRLVTDWHAATAERLPPAERPAHVARGELLFRTLTNSWQLRDLASSPLLCAVLCALNYASPGGLPHRRVEVYDRALAMMLGRRDRDRGVTPLLTDDEQWTLLQYIAQRFLNAGLSEASRHSTERMIATVARSLPNLPRDPASILVELLERSGVIRLPAADTIDFVHRSFLEYLAARSLLDEGRIEELLAHVWSVDWADVITLAVGSARSSDALRLMRGILDQVDREPSGSARQQQGRDLLARCISASTRVDIDVHEKAMGLLSALVPPATRADADAVVALGQAALPLLNRHLNAPGTDSLPLIDTIARIGGDRAMGMLREHAARCTVSSHYPLVSAWSHFDPARYATQVLAAIPGQTVWIFLEDVSRLPFTPLLPERFSVHLSVNVPGETFPALASGARVRSLEMVARDGMAMDWLVQIAGVTQATFQDLDALELDPRTGRNHHLQRLVLYDCFTGEAFLDCRTLLCFPALEELAVYGPARIRNLHFLGHLPALRVLFLDDASAVEVGPSVIESASLRDVELPRLAAQDLMLVSGCDNLERLDVRESAITSMDGAAELPELYHLRATDCTSLEDLTAIADLGRLTELDLRGCGALPIEARAHLYGWLPHLNLDERLSLAPDDDVLGLRPATMTDIAEAVGDTVDGDMRDALFEVFVPVQDQNVPRTGHHDGWMVGELEEIHRTLGDVPGDEDG